jgi:S-adenosylmethionine uptake transporter
MKGGTFEEKNVDSRHLTGLLLSLAAFTLWTGGDSLAKHLSNVGMPPILLVGLSGLLCCLFLAAKAATKESLRRLWPTSPKWVVLRAIINLFTGVCFYSAYRTLPLANAYVVEFVGPLLVALGAAIFFKEKLSILKGAIILMGFVGAVIAVDPSLLSAQGGGMGYLFSIAGTLLMTANQLILRRISGKETPEAIMFASNLLSVLFFLLPQVTTALSFSAMDYLCLAVFSTLSLSGFYMFLASLERTTSANAAFAQYWQIVPGALIGTVVWDTLPTTQLLVGAAIIIAAGILLARETHKNNPD